MGSDDKREIPRLSYQGLLVLRTFLDRPRKELCGADLIRLTGLPSGTLYPLLLRFERYEMLESYWEDVVPEHVGRPRRRLYKITRQGAQIAHQKLSDVSPAQELKIAPLCVSK
jgi:PadR family transcriptional regulator, regulatory protein PadR